MFKIINKNSTVCKIYLIQLWRKQHHVTYYHSGIFAVNFEHISYIAQLPLLLTLNMYLFFRTASKSTWIQKFAPANTKKTQPKTPLKTSSQNFNKLRVAFFWKLISSTCLFVQFFQPLTARKLETFTDFFFLIIIRNVFTN